MAKVLTGWAGAAKGDVTEGLAQLREGLDGVCRLGAELRLPYYFTLLAETLGRAGLVGEAHDLVRKVCNFSGSWAINRSHE